MSFQRILESARRLGTPVIVSDLAGRDPMVILPLDVFEALSSGSGFTVEEEMEIGPAIEPTREPNSPSVRDIVTPPEMGFRAAEPPPIAMESEAGISMEDRFYLEPLEEEQK